MIFSIIFNLLIIFLILYFFGNFFGKKGAPLLACFNLFLCLFLAVYEFFEFLCSENNISFIFLGNWMTFLYLDISWNFLIDSLSILMVLTVIMVSFCVHLYSFYYMKDDQNIIKFFSYITLFTFFMCILVLSSNFLILFLGWEGVGLCSFLLISFWNTRLQANKSALKAMLINRVGDFFLFIAIILLVINFKSLDYLIIFSQVHIYSLKYFYVYGYKYSIIDLISILILLGSITKSAQLGLHGWLPDAMEGPTPVSALIHAATMVTAGIFLIIRTSFIFEFSTISLKILLYLGCLTAFLFGIVGLFQYDIKKIIAFSTCSQLGYMMLSCGLSAYNFSFFHLFTHASFKALLFLSAGTFIHLMGNEQDLRKMSGTFNLSWLNCICFIIGSVTLMGFPFLSGFFSKELIIQAAFLYNENPIVFLIIELSTALTILYSLKTFYYLFFKKNFNNRKFTVIVDFNIFNYIPLIILSVISIFGGCLFKTIFVGYGNNFFYGSIFTLNQSILEIEFIYFYIKVIPVLLLIILSFFFYEFYVVYFIKNQYLYFYLHDAFLFFNKRMFVDSLLNLFINFFFFRLSYKTFFLFDKGFLEVFGPFGIISVFYVINDKLYNLFYGKIKGQVFIFFLFFVLVLIFYFFFLVCLKVL